MPDDNFKAGAYVRPVPPRGGVAVSAAAILSRFRIDPYLFALIGVVTLAAILPARGVGAPIMDGAVYGAVALLFFLYGARLAPQAVAAGIAHWRLQSLVFASTFILFPAIGLTLTALLRPFLSPDLSLGLMFICVLPSTVQSSIAFTSIARGNVPAALCAASISNLFGMLLTPALVALLLNAHGAGLSMTAVKDIALQLLAPFVAGQLLRPLIGAWLLRHKTITSVVDRGSILVVVYAAFSAGMAAGVWSQLSLASLALVLLLDATMLGLVLVVTTLVARWSGFSTEDEIAIVFCGSKKSMAGGIPMANILFPGHPVGLIVLPLMLFHQAQLFACATLAQRYAQRAASRPARASAPAAGRSISLQAS
jgi:solute carrier family 10 (sodium/bile acid cotransporter), member 7